MKPELISPATQGFLRDESHMAGFAEGIAFPETTENLANVVNAAAESGVRLTVQGARTGLTGGAVPQGGWVVNLSRMTAEPEFFDREGFAFVRVQAGVTLERIEAAAAARGLYFAPNPTEPTATIGGMYATGASGMSSLACGEVARFVQRLRWVTPQGGLWDIRRGAFRFDEIGCTVPDGRRLPLGGYAGCDLIEFLSGSEGRWGIAAELELILLPLPKECWGVVYFFPNSESLLGFAEGLAAWQKTNAPLLFAAEYYNEQSLALLGAAQNTAGQSLPGFPEGARAALYVELRGDDGAELEQALEGHLALFAQAGGDDAHTWAETGDAVRRLRGMRHTLVEALASAQGEESMKYELDFAAPPERFAETLRACGHGLEGGRLRGVIYGHILQNRMHVALSPQTDAEREAAGQALSALAGRIVRDGGSLAAEYGMGRISRPWMDGAMTSPHQAERQAAKAFFDPSGRLGA